jgi:hypothetical protein
MSVPVLQAGRIPGTCSAEPVTSCATGQGQLAPKLLSWRPGLAQGVWMLRSLAAAARATEASSLSTNETNTQLPYDPPCGSS